MKILYLASVFAPYVHYPIVKLDESFHVKHFTYFFVNYMGYLVSKKYRQLWSRNRLTVAIDPAMYQIVKLYRLPRIVLKWIYPYIMYLMIYKKVVKGSYDIIHANNIDPCGKLAYLLSKRLGIPYIITEHGPEYYLNDISKNKKIKIINRYKKVTEKASFIIAVSEKFNEFLKSYWAKANIITIHNSYNSYIFKPPSIEGENFLALNETKINIISVGSYNKIKNQILLLNAIKKVKYQCSEIHLTLVGDGWLQEEYKKFVLENELNEIVTIKDFMPHHQLVNEYYNSDIFVLTSIKETFGIVLLEAMACGVPVIASITDGSVSVIEDNLDGLLFQNGNLDDLVTKIMSLVQCKQLRQRMREFGYKKVAKFNMKHKEIYELYLSVLNDACYENKT